MSSPEIVCATARYGTTADIFPGMAHDVMIDTGWVQVAGRIRGWLDDQVLTG
ncbi:MAG: hypothetical protein ABIJ39_11355 [Chloroflexota bacterium]